MVSKTSGKTKLFISYSRKDRGRIERLYDALASEEDLRVFRDTDDILPTEEWKPRLEKLIRESDTIVFALSPASAASEVCAWELELAVSLNKRIIPIVVENVDGAVPEAVSKLNYIFLTEADDFGRGLTKIQDAISLDIDWVREHTRLGELADRWEKAVRLGAQPLRGKELEAAERWLVEQPKNAPQPTELQRRYILESRKAATRRARTTVMGSVAAMLIVGVLGVFAWVQRGEAVAQKEGAQIKESLFFEAEARKLIEEGRADAALELARYALPDTDTTDSRPLVESSNWLFSNAAFESRGLHFLNLHSDGSESEAMFSKPPCLAISRDGSNLGYCHRQHVITLYHVDNARIVRQLDIHFRNSGLIAFSDDQSKLAAVSTDGFLAQFDLGGSSLTEPVRLTSERFPPPDFISFIGNTHILVVAGSAFVVNTLSGEVSNIGTPFLRGSEDHLARSLKFAFDPMNTNPTWFIDIGSSNWGDERILWTDGTNQSAGEDLTESRVFEVKTSSSGRFGLISQGASASIVSFWNITAQSKISEFHEVYSSCFMPGLDFPVLSSPSGVQLASLESGKIIWTAGSQEERDSEKYKNSTILCGLGNEALGILVGTNLEIWRLTDSNPASEHFGLMRIATIGVLPEGIDVARLVAGGTRLIAANRRGFSGLWNLSPSFNVAERTDSAVSFVDKDAFGAFSEGEGSRIIHRFERIEVSIRRDLDAVDVINRDLPSTRVLTLAAASAVLKFDSFGSGRFLVLLRDNGQISLFDLKRGLALGEYSASTFLLNNSRVINFAIDEKLGLMYLLTNKDKVVSFPLQPRPAAEIFARSAATFSDGSMLTELERCEMNIAEANVCW